MSAPLTNQERLQRTLRRASETWEREGRSQARNALNEGAWSVQVIEPILASLGWARLRRRETAGTGAFFEWPGKHSVDVALLHRGEPVAFIELKSSRRGSKNDLPRKLKKHAELAAAFFAVSSWFDDGGGFDIHQVLGGSALAMVDGAIAINNPRDAARRLAILAAPVLTKTIRDAAVWLSAGTNERGPDLPRCSPREAQRSFFRILHARLGMKEPLKLRHRTTFHNPPTPTYAFAELPSLFPPTWGIVFDFDNTMNRMNCFFFRGTNRQVSAVRLDFDDLAEPFGDGIIEQFIDELVVPAIRRISDEFGVAQP